jgi:hypothetical protein
MALATPIGALTGRTGCGRSACQRRQFAAADRYPDDLDVVDPVAERAEQLSRCRYGCMGHVCASLEESSGVADFDQVTIRIADVRSDLEAMVLGFRKKMGAPG